MFKDLAAGLFGVPTRQEKELHNNQIRHARQVGKQQLTYIDHNKFIEDYKKELLRSVNEDIEQSLHEELVKLGWTPPKKESE